MEYIAIALFCLSLFICLITGISIVFALAAGLVIFFAYAVCAGHSFRDVIGYCASGISTVKNILITFFLIGMLTALWRAAGTIPMIVCLSTKLIKPSVFLLMAFLLNCLISFLTGTAFGTGATMGVICATIGSSLGISPALVGGAVLSGAYFGDRCSPVSTSALLIATLTDTDIFTNVRNMLRTAAVPFLMTCAIYTLIGGGLGSHGAIADFSSVFGREFSLTPLTVLPAAVLLLLSLCRVNVKIAMAASIITALPICLFIQHTPVQALPALVLTGYKAADAEIGAMLSGGGITSMLKVTTIVCISSAYSGIFQNTGLLERIKARISDIAQMSSSFAAILLTSILTGMIACNQALTILLTHQLSDGLEDDKARFAMELENTAVVTAALVPWSIAGGVVLAAIGSPSRSVLFACFLYLLPLYGLVMAAFQKKKAPRGI